MDPETVASALRELWRVGKFQNKRVVVGVSNQKVVVRQVELPWMPHPELKKALPFQAQDFIPMPIEQAILDFHPLEEYAGEGDARMQRLLLVAAARDMVDNALQAVQKAGLTPVMVDLTPFAVLRSLAPVSEVGHLDVDAEAIVDVGAGVTNILVHQGGVPRFVRILLMGGDDITEAVSERMGVPMEHAESVKQSMGIPMQPPAPEVETFGVPGVETPAAHPAARAIDQAASSFVDEIRGSLGYYFSQPSAVRVRRVLLSGGGAMLAGLAQRLSAATRLPVEIAQPSAALRMGRHAPEAHELTSVESMLTVPVGLAMGVAA